MPKDEKKKEGKSFLAGLTKSFNEAAAKGTFGTKAKEAAKKRERNKER